MKTIFPQRFPLIRQQDSKDCGPSCLRMISSFYGRDLAQSFFTSEAGLTRDGVTLSGINEAAERMGFITAALRSNPEDLYNMPLPAIIHWKGNHFVVLHKIRRDRFYIADPGIGRVSYPKSEFLDKWKGNRKKGVILLLEPGERFHQQAATHEFQEKRSSLTFLKKYLGKHRRKIFQLMGCLLLASFFQYLFPYVTQGIVDTGIKQKDIGFIRLMLLAQFVLFFAQAFTEFIRARILLFISTHFNLSILSAFWKKLMKLPMHFFESRNTGDILQRINDHRRIESFITGNALQTLFSVFSILIFSVVLFNYNPLICSVFIAGSFCYVLWIRIFLRKRRILDQDRFAAAARESSATMQFISGMQEIKLNNAERHKRKEWQELQSRLFQLNYRSLSMNQYQQAGAFFINQGKNILITYLAAIAVVGGYLTLGQMLAIQFIIGQLNSPVEQLVQFIQQGQEARMSLDRLNAIHDLKEEEQPEAGEAFQHSIPMDTTIRFKELGFAYPGNDPVLHHINLSIPAQRVTALVGMSGSGKTTLLKLLLKFYEDYTGQIRVGNKDLKQISPSYWRSVCGNVLQEGFIFNDTIARNIALSESKPDLVKVQHAAHIAEIASFVETLPMKYETRIGAEGNGLSAGQKQRLLIARAIYKNPEFIFLDEATNALDANNERAIIDNLQQFFKGRTVVIAAHRLSTIINADKIVLIDNGSIIGEGTHESLMDMNESYRELVSNQLAMEH